MAGLHNTPTQSTLSLVPSLVHETLSGNSYSVISLPVNEISVRDTRQDLKSAFELFNQMSQQLTDSYSLLENRVAELNQELNSVADQRLQELAEKEKIANRLENLLNFLPGGVVVLDSSGRISESNPAAVDLLGEPLQGQLWREVIARSFAPRKDDGHEVSLRDGRRISISTRNLLTGKLFY
jgi:two-component system, sensor histidine kinase FlrB